jgi:hypothetical protein
MQIIYDQPYILAERRPVPSRSYCQLSGVTRNSDVAEVALNDLQGSRRSLIIFNATRILLRPVIFSRLRGLWKFVLREGGGGLVLRRRLLTCTIYKGFEK